jgi:hypothetical protein
MIIGQPKPDGSTYTNTEADWLWLSGEAGKAARWLRYIPFDQIFDNPGKLDLIYSQLDRAGKR